MFTATTLALILFFVFLAYIALGVILMYHWFKFAMSTTVAVYASVAYTLLGFTLMFTMLTSVLYLMQ